MIELNKYDILWIRACKGHMKNYPYEGEWVITLKPLFKEIYGWDPDIDNNYHDYLYGLFQNLFEVFMKIQYPSGNQVNQLKDLFKAAFYKGISNDSDIPIERTIHELCGLIQNNLVLNPDKSNRYILD